MLYFFFRDEELYFKAISKKIIVNCQNIRSDYVNKIFDMRAYV